MTKKINEKIEALTANQADNLLIELGNMPDIMKAIKYFNNFHMSNTLASLAIINPFKDPDKVCDYQGFYKGVPWLEIHIERLIKERNEKINKEEEAKSVKG